MKSRVGRFFAGLQAEKGLIVLCFVLAFLAWQSIRRNISLKFAVANVAVEVEVPAGWAVMEKSTDRVKVHFSGSKEDIRDLTSERLFVVVPVEEPREGEPTRVRLVERNLRGNPSSARVVGFAPEELAIVLDREAEKELPIKAALSGSLPEGLEISRIVCQPATAVVRGAQQRLAAMENVRTAAIDLAGRKESFQERFSLALPAGSKLESAVEWVVVTCELVQRNRDVTLGAVPVRVLDRAGAQRRIVVQPAATDLLVRGQARRVEQLLKADVVAYVDCTGLEEAAVYMLPVLADLPEGLQLVQTEPAVVQVEISNPKQEIP